MDSLTVLCPYFLKDRISLFNSLHKLNEKSKFRFTVVRRKESCSPLNSNIVHKLKGFKDKSRQAFKLAISLKVAFIQRVQFIFQTSKSSKEKYPK